MSLLNVLRGSQSLPLVAKSSASIQLETAGDAADAVVFYYYFNPVVCTFEQMLISTLIQSSSSDNGSSSSIPARLIEKKTYTTDVSPTGLLPIWVNESNGHVLDAPAILSTYFPDISSQHGQLISQLAAYFRLKDKNNLFRWNFLNYLASFVWSSVPLPELPTGPEAAAIPLPLAFAVYHCSMCLLPLNDPLRTAIEMNEELSAMYLRVLESKYTNTTADSGFIRCICGDDEDDGFTIQCERCLVWQHARCVGVRRSAVPEQYFCERCGPIDINALSVGSSANVSASDGAAASRTVNIIATTTATTTTTTANANATTTTSTANATATTTTTTTTATTTTIPTPPGVPSCNEVSENIISPEAKPILKSLLSGLSYPVLLRRQQLFQSTCPGNFEFTALPCFPAPEPPSPRPGLEVREIRTRGYQKKGAAAKYGLFTREACDPGHFIAEFVGHLQPKDAIKVHKNNANNLPVHVTQSFVLFLPDNLVIDARKFGTPVRYIRRSCRPNCHVKQFLCDDGRRVGWGLFAKNIVRAGGELLLPLDYASSAGGNRLFRYDCACNAPEFCLGPIDSALLAGSGGGGGLAAAGSTIAARSSSPLLTGGTAVAVGVGVVGDFVSADEAAAAGIVGVRRSASVTHLSSSAAAAAAAAIDDEPAPIQQRPVLDTRKLTREERKLQQYIEYFERMDSAAETAKNRSAGSLTGGAGSRSRASTSPKSGSGSAGRTAGGSSPKGAKKSWKTLFGAEAGAAATVPAAETVVVAIDTETTAATTTTDAVTVTAAGTDDVDISFESVGSSEGTDASAAAIAAKGKRGRKPGSKNKPKTATPAATEVSVVASVEAASSASAAESTAPSATAAADAAETTTAADADEESLNPRSKRLKTSSAAATSPVKRKKSPELAIVDEDLDIGEAAVAATGDGEESMAPGPSSKKKQQKQRKQRHPSTAAPIVDVEADEATREEEEVVDVGGGDEIEVNEEESLICTATEPATALQPQSQSLPPQPDTPTKKKLSLSDYLKKKKASPQEPAPLSDFPVELSTTTVHQQLSMEHEPLSLTAPVVMAATATATAASMERSRSVQELREEIFGDGSSGDGGVGSGGGEESPQRERTAYTSGRASSVISERESRDRDRDRERERERDRDYHRHHERDRDRERPLPTYNHHHRDHDRQPYEKPYDRSTFRDRDFDKAHERFHERDFTDRSPMLPLSSSFDRERGFDRDYSDHRSFDRDYTEHRSLDRDYADHRSFDRLPERPDYRLESRYERHDHRFPDRPPPPFEHHRDYRDHRPTYDDHRFDREPPLPHHRYEHRPSSSSASAYPQPPPHHYDQLPPSSSSYQRYRDGHPPRDYQSRPQQPVRPFHHQNRPGRRGDYRPPPYHSHDHHHHQHHQQHRHHSNNNSNNNDYSRQ